MRAPVAMRRSVSDRQVHVTGLTAGKSPLAADDFRETRTHLPAERIGGWTTLRQHNEVA